MDSRTEAIKTFAKVESLAAQRNQGTAYFLSGQTEGAISVWSGAVRKFARMNGTEEKRLLNNIAIAYGSL